MCSLGCAQILGCRFAGPAVCNDIKRNLLSLVEGAHAGAFDGADMNENVLASLVRLNEAKTLLAVEPLHSSRIHGRSSSYVFGAALESAASKFEVWKRFVSQARNSRRGQVVRPKLGGCIWRSFEHITRGLVGWRAARHESGARRCAPGRRVCGPAAGPFQAWVSGACSAGRVLKRQIGGVADVGVQDDVARLVAELNQVGKMAARDALGIAGVARPGGDAWVS